MICEKYHMADVQQITEAKQIDNIKRVQELVAEFMAGRPEGYLVGVADDIKAVMLGGLIPGADCIKNKAEFTKVMGELDKYMEVKKFEPCNWRAVGDDVLFNVNWEFVWKATGKTVTTTALVRKVMRNNMICEKYHMVDVEEITGEKKEEAATVKRVKELLAEFQAGRPEGYMAGVADDVKADMLGGLIPGADCIKNKVEFAKVMGDIDKYLEVKKFEPCNFRALPNNDMMFNVNWEFVWKATGRLVTTTAIVRKVLKDNMICEKYHMADVQQITEAK